jgi:hypothetical protein
LYEAVYAAVGKPLDHIQLVASVGRVHFVEYTPFGECDPPLIVAKPACGHV